MIALDTCTVPTVNRRPSGASRRTVPAAPAATASDTLATWSIPENEPVTTTATEPGNGSIRWYDPITGRWLSKDPIGISGGLNQYVFCKNAPTMWRDPLGLINEELVDAGVDIVEVGALIGIGGSLGIPMAATLLPEAVVAPVAGKIAASAVIVGNIGVAIVVAGGIIALAGGLGMGTGNDIPRGLPPAPPLDWPPDTDYEPHEIEEIMDDYREDYWDPAIPGMQF